MEIPIKRGLFYAAVAPHFVHYDLVRVRETLRVTPALATNVKDRLWSLEELVERHF